MRRETIAPDTLSLRDSQVFDLRVDGKRPTEIARELNLSVTAVLASMERIAKLLTEETADMAVDAYALSTARHDQLYSFALDCIKESVRRYMKGEAFDPEPLRMALQIQVNLDKMNGFSVPASKRKIANLSDASLPELVKLAKKYKTRIPELTAFPTRVIEEPNEPRTPTNHEVPALPE